MPESSTTNTPAFSKKTKSPSLNNSATSGKVMKTASACCPKSRDPTPRSMKIAQTVSVSDSEPPTPRIKPYDTIELSFPDINANDSVSIEANVYPSGSTDGQNLIINSKLVIILLHSGCFSRNLKENRNMKVATVLSNGLGCRCQVVVPDYRVAWSIGKNGKRHDWKSGCAMHDIKKTVEKVKESANLAGFTESEVKIGLVGCSSGGFFAYEALRYPELRRSLSFVIGLAPVADPWVRLQYLLAGNKSGLRDGHNKFFGTVSSSSVNAATLTREDASYPSGWTKEDMKMWDPPAPPSLLLYGDHDENVPVHPEFDVLKSVREWVTRERVIPKLNDTDSPGNHSELQGGRFSGRVLEQVKLFLVEEVKVGG